MADIDIQFIANHPPYFSGEVATFPEADAQRLIAAGTAVPVTAPEPEPEAPSPLRGRRATALTEPVVDLPVNSETATGEEASG